MLEKEGSNPLEAPIKIVGQIPLTQVPLINEVKFSGVKVTLVSDRERFAEITPSQVPGDCVLVIFEYRKGVSWPDFCRELSRALNPQTSGGRN